MIRNTTLAIIETLKAQRLPKRTFREDLMCRLIRRTLAEGNQKGGIHGVRKSLSKLKTPTLSAFKVRREDGKYGDIPSIRITPKKAHSSTILVYFHGGGYVMGSPETYTPLLSDLAHACNCKVIAPDYALAPEATFPKPQDDCVTAVEAIADAYPDSQIVLIGDSAGAALAFNTARRLIGRDISIASLVLLSPWVNPLAEGGSINELAEYDFLTPEFLKTSYSALIKDANPKNEQSYLVSPKVKGLPRTLIQYGTAEIFRDQIELFIGALKGDGLNVEVQAYPDQCHVFQLLASVSCTARQSLARIGVFVHASD